MVNSCIYYLTIKSQRPGKNNPNFWYYAGHAMQISSSHFASLLPAQTQTVHRRTAQVGYLMCTGIKYNARGMIMKKENKSVTMLRERYIMNSTRGQNRRGGGAFTS